MIIKTKKQNKPYPSNNGFTLTVKTEEGWKQYSLYTGEPEDMIFGRNLTDEKPLKKMLKMAYYAGRNGEALNIESNEIVE